MVAALVVAETGIRSSSGQGSAESARPAGADVSAASPSKLLTVRLEAARVAVGPVTGAWQSRSFDDRAWAVAPGLVIPRAGLAAGAVAPGGVTAVDVSPGGSLLLRTHFDVAAPASARVLELRVTYSDGFVAYLNGTEVARRNLPATPPGARPAIVHGTDPERIFVPVRAPSGLLQSSNNVLAVEVRPSARRLPVDVNAPTGEVGVAVASGVRIVRGPYLIAPAEREVSVAWETDLPARGSVRFHLADDGDKRVRQVAAPKLALRQVARLARLSAGAHYQYQVDVEGASSGDTARSVAASFETAPPSDRPLRFIVYGDMRAPGHAAHAEVVAGIRRERPALVINTGDLVAVGGEESAWQRYFEITAPMGATVAVAPALGNHESYAGGAAGSWTLFGLRSASPLPGVGYTSFDWGGAHFVILDSNHPDAAQRQWVDQDLTAARKRHPRAIFAVLHDGPWSHGSHGGSRGVERAFASALATGGVDVLFSGHDHLYERGVGVTSGGPLPYVVSGGGGAPLYNPTCQPVGSASMVPPASVARGGAGTANVDVDVSMPLPPCPATVAIVQKTYHYLVIEVTDGRVRICPRLPDGVPIEPCVDRPLRSRSRRLPATP